MKPAILEVKHRSLLLVVSFCMFLMRDEKEKRKKQARSNHRSRSMVKQTNKAKQHVQVRTYVYMHVSLILYFAHV